MVMTIWTFYPYGPLKYVAALAYAQSAMRTSIEGYHYSVDFILPAVLCVLVYRELAWVYPASAAMPPRKGGGPQDQVSRGTLAVVAAAVVFLAVNMFFVGA